jgi:hypothetical protein
MGRAGTVTVTSRMNEVVREETRRMDLAVGKWAADTHNTAQRLAPHLTGALQNSGKIKRNAEADWQVSFGNAQVPYARRRHFENFRNPGTLRYLERPGDANSKNFVQRYM